jgi:hypothetical protein
LLTEGAVNMTVKPYLSPDPPDRRPAPFAGISGALVASIYGDSWVPWIRVVGAGVVAIVVVIFIKAWIVPVLGLPG